MGQELDTLHFDNMATQEKQEFQPMKLESEDGEPLLIPNIYEGIQSMTITEEPETSTELAQLFSEAGQNAVFVGAKFTRKLLHEPTLSKHVKNGIIIGSKPPPKAQFITRKGLNMVYDQENEQAYQQNATFQYIISHAKNDATCDQAWKALLLLVQQACPDFKIVPLRDHKGATKALKCMAVRNA